MRNSFRKVLVLFCALAALGRQASATPIVSQVQRVQQVSAAWSQGVQNFDFTNLPGPADLSASATDYRADSLGGGTDFINVHSSQISTVDAFGFSYTSSIALDYFNHGDPGPGGGSAFSTLRVTYLLDQPYAYEFTRGGSSCFCFLDDLPFGPNSQSPYGPISGVLQPGSYTFLIRDFGSIVAVPERQGSFAATGTATLRLSPLSVPDGDLPGSELFVLMCGIGGVGWMARRRAYPL
jgi:hypothetical protein